MGSHYVEQTDQDDLISYFDRSATVVQESLQRLEQRYARPGVGFLIKSFREHPIRSTFLSVFAFLSLLPTLSFVGFSVFVFAAFTFISLASALFSATVVVSLIGIILAAILAVLLSVSAFLTASWVGIYLAFRLVMLVREDGPRSGVSRWAQEFKMVFFKFDPASDSTSSSGLQEEGEVVGSGPQEAIVIGGVDVDSALKKEEGYGQDPDVATAEETKSF